MAGLLDSPLVQMAGLNRPGSPVGTLQALSAMRGQNAAAGPTAGSVNLGPPSMFKGYANAPDREGVGFPDMAPPDISTAMDEGAARASRDASGSRHRRDDEPPPPPGGDGAENSGPLGFNPKVLDLARAMAPNGDDNRSALARAGIGMAEAGGRTGNFLSALAAGAGQGFDYLQRQRANRAQMALEQAKVNNESGYRSASLAQTGQYQQGMLGLQGRQATAAEQEAALKAAKSPAEIALAEAQAKGALAEAGAEHARAGLYGAQASALSGSDGGIPAKIWKESMAQASRAMIGRPYQTPEAQAAELNARATEIAKNTMLAQKMDITGVAAFDRAPTEAPAAAASPAKPAWIGGAHGVPEDVVTDSQPLLKNPVVMVPGNQLETLAQRGTFGAIDLGATRNMAETSLAELKNDYTNLQKASGRAIKDQIETLNAIQPKQGIFVSAPENFDKLHQMWNTAHQNYLQNLAQINDPRVPKAQRDIAAKSAPLEARILFRIGGAQTPADFERFAGPGGDKGPKVGAVEDGHRFKGGNPGDPANWEPVQ